MRGHVFKLRLIGMRLESGPDEGKPYRDSEGRWVADPDNPPHDVSVREYIGWIGHPRHSETPDGETVDNAAHLPRGTLVNQGDELEAWDTGDPNLDGRYAITAVQAGPVMTRVLLRRATT